MNDQPTGVGGQRSDGGRSGDLFGDITSGKISQTDIAPACITQAPHVPLAEQLRPSSLAEVAGQSHLLGVGRPLRVLLDKGQVHSMILWGPPGVGKTTLARLIALTSNCGFLAISAVLAGVKEIREAIAQAQHWAAASKRSVLFIDEIHRFNKSQQDALLPHVESGLVTFIGATTENPSFEVNSALLSRSQVYVLQGLESADLLSMWERARSKLNLNWNFSESALNLLVQWSDGDGRRFLNLIEIVAGMLAEQADKPIDVSADQLQQLLPAAIRRFDKGGDQFYDQISALHKAVRGSDPDAALYWLCRMIDGGTDPLYLARRVVRMAWEDIGLADPRAISLVQDAAFAFERLGSPEGELALAQAVIYLAVAPKSNAGYVAYKRAMSAAKDHGTAPVPIHLRNAPTKLMKNLGHGQGYRYAHDEQDAIARGESYWPDQLAPQTFYEPVDRGLEIKIREKLAWIRSGQAKDGSQ